jgi:hypothetical protein
MTDSTPNKDQLEQLAIQIQQDQIKKTLPRNG